MYCIFYFGVCTGRIRSFTYLSLCSLADTISTAISTAMKPTWSHIMLLLQIENCTCNSTMKRRFIETWSFKLLIFYSSNSAMVNWNPIIIMLRRLQRLGRIGEMEEERNLKREDMKAESREKRWRPRQRWCDADW